MDTFGERLKELRKEKGLTLVELANKTMLSKSSIQQWETNYAQPAAPAIITLAKFFNVTADYLLGLED